MLAKVLYKDDKNNYTVTNNIDNKYLVTGDQADR